jgi:hypothetical protein
MAKKYKILKGIKMIYDEEKQELTIADHVGNEVVVNKVYMFSIFTFIKQLSYQQFIKKWQMNTINKVKEQKEKRKAERLAKEAEEDLNLNDNLGENIGEEI